MMNAMSTTAAATEDRYWRACLDRDAAFDGRVILAVRTTGIYCRPSCPARKPRRENVAFFALPELARRAGYRPRKRRRPDAQALPRPPAPPGGAPFPPHADPPDHTAQR